MIPIKRNTTAEETKAAYSAGGIYTSDREALHRSIVARALGKAGSTASGRPPLAVLIGGGTASGKTSLRKSAVEGELQKLGVQAATVDADEIKEQIPEYEAFKAAHPKDAARLVHRESCDIAVMLLKELLRLKKHFIYEGTMARTERYLQLVGALRRHGYEIHVYVVDVPLLTALRRSDERARVTGRKVPHSIIRYTHRKVPLTVEALKDKVDRYHVYDNRDGLKLIASNSYVHRDMYGEFLAKAGIKYRSGKMQPKAAVWRIPHLTQEHADALRKYVAAAGQVSAAHDNASGEAPANGKASAAPYRCIDGCDCDDLLDLLPHRSNT